MDEQEQQDQAAEQAAFERSFAEAAGIEPPTPAAASTDATAGEGAEPAATQAAEAEAPAQDDTPAAEQPAGQDAQQEQPAQDDDPVLLDGLKRSELRRLFENAADVENLKRQLDKAHGNIGELNRRLQQAQAPAPAAAPASASQPLPESSPDMKRFEEDFPEIAQYVRAMGGPSPKPSQTPPADVHQSADAGAAQAAQAGPDPLAVEAMVMDRMHSGWREKLASQEFNLWLASQDDEVRQAYDTAMTADAMAGVLGQYDQWAAARSAAADKAAKGQQRLQKAVTPSGNAQRPQAAPTELEAMEAAFKKTLGL
jgi:hypothetical protein